MPNPVIRGRTGGGAFTPPKLPGLQLWLRADKGLYQDSVFTTLATADADPVGGWQDQSGQAHHAIQATSSKRPVRKLAIVNGQPTVRFDGVDDFLAGAFALLTSGAVPVTIIAVVNLTSVTTTQAADLLEIGQSGSRNATRAYGAMVGITANGDMWGSNIANDRGTATGTVSTSTWYVLTYRWDGGAISASNPTFYRNGTAQASSAGTGTSTPNITDTSYTLSTNVGLTTQYVAADYAEVIVVSRALTTQERQQTERYLGQRYGLVVA